MIKKYLLTLFIALFSYLSAMAAVSLETAKEKVKDYVENTLKLQGSIIYYNTTNDTKVELFRREPMKPASSSWLFFVDQRPGAGWSHPVNVIFVSKSNGAIKCISSDMPLLKMESWKSLNPSSKSKPNERSYSNNANTNNVQLRYDSNGFLLKAFSKTEAHNPNSYAVIISGGINHNKNYVRYWNDCSLIYQTLVDIYGFEKDKIYVLMADGPEGENNVNIGSEEYPRYVTAPTDLDRDGTTDINFAARRNLISNVFNSLAQRMNSESNLFVFTTDHGGKYDGLCLWHFDDDLWNDDNQNMTPAQFNTELAKLRNRKSISILMAQCYSGAFANNIHLNNSTICTAANDNEWSWGGGRYDDFAYHFTMALTKTISGIDADSDSEISFKEAFDYAYQNDYYVKFGTWYNEIHYYEHPQYWSDGCYGEKQYVYGPLEDKKNLCCTLSSNTLKKANKNITSTTSILKGNVDFQSYGNILLKKGFKVSTGAKFKGTILECNSSNTNANQLRSLDIDEDFYEFEIDSEITDIDDVVSEIDGVKIFPNPTDGVLYVHSNDVIKKLILTDLTGKVMMDEYGDSDEMTLDLSSQAKGLYLLNVVTENDSYVEKILLK